MPCRFGEDDFLRVQVQKRRRSGFYAEYFAPVLSENQTSETVRYLVWVILVSAAPRMCQWLLVQTVLKGLHALLGSDAAGERLGYGVGPQGGDPLGCGIQDRKNTCIALSFNGGCHESVALEEVAGLNSLAYRYIAGAFTPHLLAFAGRQVRYPLKCSLFVLAGLLLSL